MTIHEELSRHLPPARLAAAYAETCKQAPPRKASLLNTACSCGRRKRDRSDLCKACFVIVQRRGLSREEILTARRERLRVARNKANRARRASAVMVAALRRLP